MTDAPHAGDWPEDRAVRRADAATMPASVELGPTETTRYLCGATHLDKDFCEHVISDLVDQPHRAVGASYGIDLAAVARHAIAAHRRRLIRDVGLLAALVALLVLVAWNLSTSDVLENFGRSSIRPLLDELSTVLLPLVAAWLITAGETWYERVRVLPKLGMTRFAPKELRPRLNGRLQARIDALEELESGNVVVFSGFNPFVGAGLPLDGWSFAIDVTKGSWDPATGKHRAPKPFDAENVHSHLVRSLMSLGLPGLRVIERLFIDGFDVGRDTRLVPERFAPPLRRAHRSIVLEPLRNQAAAGRTYLCLEAAGWHGQLVVTMFVRVVRLPASLFVETTSFVLLPLKSRYYRIDAVAPRSPVEASFAALGAALGRFLPMLVASPVWVASAVRRARRASRRSHDERWVIANRRLFDYGAYTSIRQDAMGADPNRYFLLLDKEMYVKVAQERLLASISDFLREHDVDTAEFAVQQTVINRNRTVNVGPVSGGNVAVAAGDVRGFTQAAPEGKRTEGSR